LSEALRRDLEHDITGEVRFDRVSRSLYSTDASVYRIEPLGVVVPRTREDVIRTVQIAARHGVSITARGGGTSQAGQAIGAGLQLDTSKYFNKVLEVSAADRTAWVEPGVVLDDLNAQLRPQALRFAPDISTASRATIGGMISNNSSGARSILYGKTIDHVLELDVVLADGTLTRFRPLDAAALDAASAGETLEARSYRAVRRIASDCAAEVDRRFPKVLRRVGGYNLDEFVDRSKPFNLAKLIVGSEGTLGLVVAAKLNLVPLPRAKAVLAIEFDELLDALGATPAIVRHRPSAVEVMDRFILDHARESPALDALRRSIMQGEAGALLCVEFYGDTPEELLPRLDALEAELPGLGYRCRWRRAIAAADQARIWSFREAALGLSMAMKGDGKSLSFVEDTAVAPEKLADYIERFLQVVKRHQTSAGVYAHASVGCLHVRPVVNMKTEEGVRRFESIANDIADLVLEFGGALSGEHGDGLVRGPFTQKMFGPVLYEAFRAVKQTFDPDGVFNPGKIVDTPPLTSNLRYGAGYATPDPATFFDYTEHGGMGRAGGDVQRPGRLPQDARRHDVPVVHGDAGGKALDPRSRERAAAGDGRTVGRVGARRRGRARRPRSLSRVPRVQGRVSGRCRRRAIQERVSRRLLSPSRHAAEGARDRATSTRCRRGRAASRRWRTPSRAVPPAGGSTSSCSGSIAAARCRRGRAARSCSRFARSPVSPRQLAASLQPDGDPVHRHVHQLQPARDRPGGGRRARSRRNRQPGSCRMSAAADRSSLRACSRRRVRSHRRTPTSCSTRLPRELASCSWSPAAFLPFAKTRRRSCAARHSARHGWSPTRACCSRTISSANGQGGDAVDPAAGGPSDRARARALSPEGDGAAAVRASAARPDSVVHRRRSRRGLLRDGRFVRLRARALRRVAPDWRAAVAAGRAGHETRRVLVAAGTSCRHQVEHFAGVKAVHPAALLRSLLK
jgi:FAD/FMN-containing dehydrogenase